MSKLARYPKTYSKILLSLPEDGTPFELTLASNESAMTERLRFYNFLKFLRRNQIEAAHFAGRENRVTILVQGPVMRFQLRTKSDDQEISQAFDDALQTVSTPSAKINEVKFVTEAGVTAPTITPSAEPPSLLDIFLEGAGKEKKP